MLVRMWGQNQTNHLFKKLLLLQVRIIASNKNNKFSAADIFL